MSMYQLYLCLVLAAAVTQALQEQCRCILDVTPDQNKYCQADFVVLATLMKQGRRGTMWKYTVRVHDVYIGAKKKLKKKRTLFWSELDLYMCGLDLLEGKTYIMSGKTVKKTFRLDLCTSLMIEESRLTSIQWENLRGEYDSNCGCKVKMCHYGRQCDDLASSSSCTATYINYNCYNKYSICKKYGRKCDWMKIDENGEDYDNSCMPRFMMGPGED